MPVQPLVGTAEVLIVERGQCEVDIYTDDRRLVATRTLNEHDIMISVGGGHGFRATQDLVLLEIKQGPIRGRRQRAILMTECADFDHTLTVPTAG